MKQIFNEKLIDNSKEARQKHVRKLAHIFNLEGIHELTTIEINHHMILINCDQVIVSETFGNIWFSYNNMSVIKVNAADIEEITIIL